MGYAFRGAEIVDGSKNGGTTSSIPKVPPAVTGAVLGVGAIYAESNARRRFAALLLSGFGALTLALSTMALAAGRRLPSQVFEMSAYDPLSFVAIPLLILLSACVASLVPGLRAAGVHPSAALKYE